MQIVKKIAGWQTKYPAFKWCADLGEGWYLPAIEELKSFTQNNTIRNTVNLTLAKNGGKKLGYMVDYVGYWSSTEDKEFRAWTVNMSYGNTYNYLKSNLDFVRAVSAF